MEQNNKYNQTIKDRIVKNFYSDINQTIDDLHKDKGSAFYKSPLQASIFAGVFMTLLVVFVIIYSLLIVAYFTEGDVELSALIIMLGPIYILYSSYQSAKASKKTLEADPNKPTQKEDEKPGSQNAPDNITNKGFAQAKVVLHDQEWFSKYSDQDILEILTVNQKQTEELLQKHKHDGPQDTEELMNTINRAYEDYMDQRAEIVAGKLPQHPKDEIEIIIDASDSRSGSRDMTAMIEKDYS